MHSKDMANSEAAEELGAVWQRIDRGMMAHSPVWGGPRAPHRLLHPPTSDEAQLDLTLLDPLDAKRLWRKGGRGYDSPMGTRAMSDRETQVVSETGPVGTRKETKLAGQTSQPQGTTHASRY
jgi:hypothetical protein